MILMVAKGQGQNMAWTHSIVPNWLDRNRNPRTCSVANLIEKEYRFRISGSEVKYTNALLLLIKIMLCSKLHCKIFLY
jgi:hypothetical protein